MKKMTSRSVRSLVVIALVAASLTAVSAPASADDFSPTITTFQRTTPGTIGSDGTVSITFDAYDEGPAGLGYAMFTFTNELGGQFRVDSDWMNRAASGTFTASRSIGKWGASGRYELTKVEVQDREWNTTTYERATATHLDFAAADFVVDNPDQDVTAPTIGSASLFQDTVLQGTPVVVLYEAEDDLSGIASVTFSGWSATRGQYWIESLPGLAEVGPASWIVPVEAASGAYESSLILVRDKAGNETMYSLDGRYVYPPKATLPEHEGPDIPSLNFTVVGRTGDRVSPTMSSFSLLTPGNRRLEEDLALQIEATDQGTGIEQIAAQWVDGKGHSIDASRYCAADVNGLIATDIDDFRTVNSDWELRLITLADYLGNQTSYMRDGTILYQNGDAGPATHTFDLSSADFHIEEGAARENTYPNTQFIQCPKVGTVSLGLDDPSIDLGETVTAIGDVILGDTPIPDPVVAIHEYVDGVASLIGVTQGDEAGNFADEFVAETKGVLQATFLGTDGPLGSKLATSNRVQLVVRSKVSASLNDTSIYLGDSATIAGAVDPVGDGGAVWLQRRYSWGWKDVRSKQVGPDGSFRFSVTPARVRTFRYRILRPGSETLAASKSPVLTLTVEKRPG